MPGYGPNQGGYGYDEASAPLPLGEAISQLPNQYVRVLTKPSAFAFASEMGKASWGILWLQLIAYAVISSVLAYLLLLMPWVAPAYTPPNGAEALPSDFLQIINFLTSFGLIILIPVSFFVGQGIFYLLAKAFGGNGTFLRQGYNNLLITVPLGIVHLSLPSYRSWEVWHRLA